MRYNFFENMKILKYDFEIMNVKILRDIWYGKILEYDFEIL